MQLYTRKDFSDNFVYELIIQLYGPTKAFELTTRKKKGNKENYGTPFVVSFLRNKIDLKVPL